MYKAKPCPHADGRYNPSTRMSDCHPLSRAEIDALLDEALTSREPCLQQVRLVQAIPGMTCPRPDQCVIGRKMTLVEFTFVEGWQAKGWTKDQRKVLYDICGV